MGRIFILPRNFFRETEKGKEYARRFIWLAGKIGLIYPAPGWVMEPEFYAMSPPG